MRRQKISGAGFTLVELLIVIGVLGVLIAGLLAAIDPVEQIRRGQDTGRKSASAELLNALNRYYTTHGDFPWEDATADPTCNDDSIDFADAPTVADADPCINELEADGELKTDFTGALGGRATELFVQSDSATDVSVCFMPDSKAIYNEPDTKYDENGVVNVTDCQPGAGGAKTAATCYWCAR